MSSKTFSQSEKTALTWKNIKNQMELLDCFSLEDTISQLTIGDYYTKLMGKAKNRTLMKENLKLYKSIMKHTKVLEDGFKKQNSYKTAYNFSHRVRFLVEKDACLDKLKCACSKRLTWTRYCRKCPDYKRNQLGKPHTEETKKRMRLSAIKYIQSLKGQVVPRYNKNSIPIIEQYGRDNGYTFMHAENGGEYFIKELGYFLDAYDPIKNVVLEVDERRHFNVDGELLEKDKERQKQIEHLLGCKFIRIKYD